MLPAVRILMILAAVVATTPAWSACSAYQQPRVLNEQEFKSTAFGTLAIPYGRRFLVFEQTGCYDLSAFSFKGTQDFFLNSTKPDEEIMHMTAAVTRLYSSKLAGVPERALDLYRNESDRQAKGSWLRARNDEYRYAAGSTIIGGQFGILLNEYRTKNPIDVTKYIGRGGVDLVSIPQEAYEWHALLGSVDDFPNPHLGYEVINNTREGINKFARHLQGMDADAEHVVTQLYLIKLTASQEPSLEKPVLSLRFHECIYIDYSIGGDREIPIGHGPGYDFLLLRFDRESDC
jgi:hypothetical protein